ncbi:histidine phosphatase family protein [Enterococcus sp. LJL128]|uniref:histidine phosphatase family protein n=1 Tax=Enterococcus sp. LJL51 TaxID=3416656 RepID=UPI003CFBB0CD
MKKTVWLAIAAIFLIAGCSSAATKETTASKDTEEKTEEIRIYLVRHGKTWFNTMNQVQGYSDSPLTETGEAQAAAVGEGLKDVKFSSAFSSDLARQKNTAKLILNENSAEVPEVTELKGFREKNFGSFEGQSNDAMNIAVAEALELDYPTDSDELWDFLKETLTEQELADKVAEVDPEQAAETYGEMEERAEKVMTEMLEEAQRKGGGNVLVVSSGGLIPILLEVVAPGEYKGEKIANCSVTTLTYKNDKYSIETIGDTTFIDQLD